MPLLKVVGAASYEIEAGKKLVLALEDSGIDVLHRCGGLARCTTCRVEVIDGAVPPMSDLEIEALETPEMIAQFRLSCQLHCNNDLTVRVDQRSSEVGIGVGPRPQD